MRAIYKYIIYPSKPYIEAPIERILTAQCQNDRLCVWAEVDTEKPNRYFYICALGTGWPLDNMKHFDKMIYISTAQQFNGELIWHVYYLELNGPMEEGAE